LADFLPALKADGGDTKTTATPDATKATASQAAQPVSAPVGTIVFPEQGGTRGKAPGPVSAEQLAKEKASSGLYRF
ncbi:MAG TPA: hypothetical protein VFS11_05860, partial [Gemmatimonadales bacterium]|nr:hypothetical protein [Gemmatimonadales bacterium]